MQQYDGAPGAVEAPEPAGVPAAPSRRSPLRVALAVLVAAALGIGVAFTIRALILGQGPAPAPPDPRPTAVAPSTEATEATEDPAVARGRAVQDLLSTRAGAVIARDRDLFLSTVDPAATDFRAGQTEVFDRLAGLDLAEWTYEVAGDGPVLGPDRATELPAGAVIVRVLLTYRLSETDTVTDRDQYLTVVPRGEAWLLAADTDAASSGADTQRDLWDLGPVASVRGMSSLVLADPRGVTRAQLRRLAEQADLAVRDVDDVWPLAWSRRPVVLLPGSQQDMATLIGLKSESLAQIAAVTTGSFEAGRSRGDRVVINPGAWETLGQLGRRVVLTHEMTHVATRSSGAQAVPIWLSEGFADYVAYRAAPVPLAIVAGDVLDEVRAGTGPRRLPDDPGFDASRGDIASSYEGAWLACRMIVARFGEPRLVRLYTELADGAGPGWPAETVEVLGINERTLNRDWRAYLRKLAAA